MNASRQGRSAVPVWRSIVARYVGGLVLGVAVASGLGILWLHQEARHDIELRFGLASESIAGTAAPYLDAALVDAVRSNDDVPGAAFQRLRDQLERVRDTNDLKEHQVYVLRPDGDRWAFVVMLQSTPFVGDPYTPPAYLLERYTESARTGRPTRTGLYTDDHGTFISGLAPIRRADGSLAGILHVDHDVHEYVDAVQQRSLTLVGLAFFLGLTLLLGGSFTYVWLNRRVAALLEGTEAIRNEQYDHRVQLHGGDELAVVAAALNDTFPRLRERFEMLKFLPKHTQAMIENASQVDLAVAKRVEVAVLESDIRGFSSLSEHMTPEATIGMLNLYIRVQAEVIGERGGSIDKYMGDAVLAVFEGPDRCQRALEAALEIQRAVGQMNDDAVLDHAVEIGVGVSEGEVVMGNMGSEQRMEHTVIGAVVNLAARLCSAAKAGEVVVQASIAEETGHAGEPEAISVKGFEQPVACLRLRA